MNYHHCAILTLSTGLFAVGCGDGFTTFGPGEGGAGGMGVAGHPEGGNEAGGQGGAGGNMVTPPKSCADVLAATPEADSGVYLVQFPWGAENVYCDMDTDGGGWTLILSYVHEGGENDELVPGKLPTDPYRGYGHGDLEHMAALPFSEVSLYCMTSAHNRVMHFSTAAAGPVEYFRGAQAAMGGWSTGFTTQSGHTTMLPLSANGGFDQPGEDRMTNFPFMETGARTWAIRALGNRWECDDLADAPGYDSDTLHHVWAR